MKRGVGTTKSAEEPVLHGDLANLLGEYVNDMFTRTQKLVVQVDERTQVRMANIEFPGFRGLTGAFTVLQE